MASFSPIVSINLVVEEGEHRVRFVDADGTVLKTCFADTGEAVVPPDNPNFDPEYLVFNKFNSQYSSINRVQDIGALYDTIDGATYLYYYVYDVTVRPTINLTKNASDYTEVYWGDGYWSYTNTSGNVAITKGQDWVSKGMKVIRISGGSFSTRSGYAFINSTRELRRIYMGSNWNTCNYGWADNLQTLEVFTIRPNYSGLLSSINLNALKAFIFPNTMSSFEGGSGYYGLKVLSIPDGVTSAIGSSYQCLNAVNLEVFSLPTTITTASVAINISASTLLKYLFLPACVKTITGPLTGISPIQSDFSKINSFPASGLGSVLISDIDLSGLTSFANNLLDGARVENLKLPETYNSSIPQYFARMTAALNKVKLPSGTTAISTYAFSSSGLIELIIPKTVTSISTYSLYSLLRAVSIVVLRASTLTTIQSTTFGAIPSCLTIYVPDERLDAQVFPTATDRYTGATNWSSYATKMLPVSDHPDYGSIYFYSDGGSYCEGFYDAPGTSVTLPTCTKSGYTFYGWNSGSQYILAGASIQIPDGVLKLTAMWV